MTHRGSGVWKWFAILGALVVAGFLLSTVVIYSNVTYVCENTGSMYGYRVGPGGARTGYWFKASPLEEFVKREDPGRLAHRWHFLGETGKNFLGESVMHSCGSAPGIFPVRKVWLEEWIKHQDRADVLALYDAFSTSTFATVDALAQKVRAEVEDY